MDNKRVWPRWLTTVRLAILVVAFVLPAWPDVHLPLPSAAGSLRIFYCGSDRIPGADRCIETCAPAKYQGRSSVKICENKQRKVRILTPLPSHITSKKNNKVQAASL